MDKPDKVIIVVRGGVAEVLSCPSWAEVEIRDYDMDEGPVITTDPDTCESFNENWFGVAQNRLSGIWGTLRWQIHQLVRKVLGSFQHKPEPVAWPF